MSIAVGTGGRSKSSSSGRSSTPRRDSSTRTASQNVRFSDRISGRLYIGKLALPNGAACPPIRTMFAPCFTHGGLEPLSHGHPMPLMPKRHSRACQDPGRFARNCCSWLSSRALRCTSLHLASHGGGAHATPCSIPESLVESQACGSSRTDGSVRRARELLTQTDARICWLARSRALGDRPAGQCCTGGRRRSSMCGHRPDTSIKAPVFKAQCCGRRRGRVGGARLAVRRKPNGCARATA
jgi:hypothetical protein